MASREVLPDAFDVADTVAHAAAQLEPPRVSYTHKRRRVSYKIVEGLRADYLEVLTNKQTKARTEFQKQPGFVVSDAEASKMTIKQAYLLPADKRAPLIAWAETQFSTAEEWWPLVAE